jgi:hypothetical protein
MKQPLIPKSMINRTGKNHFASKGVNQKLIECNGVIAIFESSGDAARKTGFNRTSIQDACRGKLKTYKGFTWEYSQQSELKHK